MKFSRNQSQKPECLRAVPDRCSAYQSLNHREIVILHRNYIQKQNRAKSLPTTYLHNKVSFLLKSYFLSYEPHKNIHNTNNPFLSPQQQSPCNLLSKELFCQLLLLRQHSILWSINHQEKKERMHFESRNFVLFVLTIRC